MVEKQTVEGGILDRFVEGVVVMEESQREDAIRFYEASMPVEFGQCVAADLQKMVEKRVEEKERKRK